MTEATFKGRNASDLTRDELILAYTYAVKDLERMRKAQGEEAAMDRLVADTKHAWRAG